MRPAGEKPRAGAGSAARLHRIAEGRADISALPQLGAALRRERLRRADRRQRRLARLRRDLHRPTRAAGSCSPSARATPMRRCNICRRSRSCARTVSAWSDGRRAVRRSCSRIRTGSSARPAGLKADFRAAVALYPGLCDEQLQANLDRRRGGAQLDHGDPAAGAAGRGRQLDAGARAAKRSSPAPRRAARRSSSSSIRTPIIRSTRRTRRCARCRSTGRRRASCRSPAPSDAARADALVRGAGISRRGI